MVFLWGETDRSGETGFNNTLGTKRADGVAACLRLAGVPPSVNQTISLGSTFASMNSRQDAASRRVEIRFQEPPADQPAQVPHVVVRPQFRVDRLPLPRIPGSTPYPPFTMTPNPDTGTQYGWPGLCKDEDRQTWCQNIATLITVSDGSGAMGNALGALCAPIPEGGSHDKFTPPLDQGTGLPNSVIFNLPPWHFNLP